MKFELVHKNREQESEQEHKPKSNDFDKSRKERKITRIFVFYVVFTRPTKPRDRGTKRDVYLFLGEKMK